MPTNLQVGDFVSHKLLPDMIGEIKHIVDAKGYVFIHNATELGGHWARWKQMAHPFQLKHLEKINAKRVKKLRKDGKIPNE